MDINPFLAPSLPDAELRSGRPRSAGHKSNFLAGCLGFLALVSAATAQNSEKALRVAFGDNRTMPVQLLKADDLVCTPTALGLGTNDPGIRMSKFTMTSRMTPAELQKRKQQGYNWICYDNENGNTWPTPKEELDDPTKFTILAAQLTHAAGLKFIAEPNFELITGQGTRITDGKLELTEKRVPSVQMKEVAPYLDAISLQLQRAQLDVPVYQKLTRQYVSELRAANPKVIIFVQVTSRARGGKESTPAELITTVRSVADDVDGIWIHVDEGQENFAAELVTLMSKAGYR